MSHLRIEAGSSEVLIGRGFPEPLLPQRDSRTAVAILHQPSVSGVAEAVERAVVDIPVSRRIIADGEEGKKMAEALGVYRWLADEGIGRADTLVVIGGGAATDSGGFVAATWMRGIEAVLIPTTLLGAVDAAIGGKTALNLDAEAGAYVKNIIGAFSLPTRVVIDLDVIEACGQSLLVEGLAEIVKAGVIGDPEIISCLQAPGWETRLDEIVPRAVRVKAAIVSGDPFERGDRAVLNFGHTIGHALEGVTGMPHGHAVSVGMVAAAVLSDLRFGLRPDHLIDLLFSLGLPIACSGVSKAAVRELIRADKKRDRTGIRMVLLSGIGSPVLATVTDDELSVALEAVGAV